MKLVFADKLALSAVTMASVLPSKFRCCYAGIKIFDSSVNMNLL